VDNSAATSTNPFRALRGDASLLAWARTTGCSVPAIAAAEAGAVAHPARLLGALARLGHDAQALDRAYQTWRSQPAQATVGAAAAVVGVGR
jgi:hypothetical protein